MSEQDQVWKHCSMCKKPIGFGQTYYRCSVSTCNQKRTAKYFCSVDCFEAHVPVLRHRDAWAEEKRAPSRERWEQQQAEDAQREQARIVRKEGEASRRIIGAAGADVSDLPRDVLLVVSKLKKYVKARSGMNTSDTVLDPLSDHIRAICNQAIRNAAQDDRKTIMGRDIPPLDRD